MSMRPVIENSILVVDDGAYNIIVARRGLTDADFDGCTVIRSTSWIGWLMRAVVWLGGPYTGMSEMHPPDE